MGGVSQGVSGTGSTEFGVEVIIDLFASEYGWSRQEIMNIYVDELFKFVDIIKKRKKDEALLELAIAHNPYSKNPNELFKVLSRDDGKSELDRAGFARLKAKLMKDSKLIKVKNGTR